MDASGADKLILLVQTNQVLYDKSAAEYKVKDALEKGDIWQIGVDIAVNSERTTDLRCRFSFLVSRWRCDRALRRRERVSLTVMIKHVGTRGYARVHAGSRGYTRVGAGTRAFTRVHAGSRGDARTFPNAYFDTLNAQMDRGSPYYGYNTPKTALDCDVYCQSQPMSRAKTETETSRVRENVRPASFSAHARHEPKSV